jgi:hypothetical protein
MMSSWAIRTFNIQFASALTTLRLVKPEAIERSLLPVSKGVKHERMGHGSSQLPRGPDWILKILPLVCVCCIAINCIGVIGGFALVVIDLQDGNWIFAWYLRAERRMVAATSIPTLMAMVSSSPGIPDETSFLANTFQRITDLHTDLDQSRIELLVGDEEDEMPPLTGFDDDLDRAELVDQCSSEPKDMYDFLSYISIDRSCSGASILIRRVLQDAKPEKECAWNDCDRLPTRGLDFSVLVILVDQLTGQLVEYGSKLLDFARPRFSTIPTTIVLIGVIVIITNVVSVMIVFLIIGRISRALDSMKTLLSFLPPRDLLADNRLVQLIMGSSDESIAVMTLAEVVLDQSFEAILSISLDYAIEGVNKAFKEVAGLGVDEAI